MGKPRAEGPRCPRLRARLLRAWAWLRRRPYYPDWFEGVLALHYPPGTGGQLAPAWRMSFYGPDGQPVPTIGKAVIHADVEQPVWAELTMFTTTDGRPALDVPRDLSGIARKRNGDFRYRTFRYLIEFVSERPAPVAAVASENAG